MAHRPILAATLGLVACSGASEAPVAPTTTPQPTTVPTAALAIPVAASKAPGPVRDGLCEGVRVAETGRCLPHWHNSSSERADVPHRLMVFTTAHRDHKPLRHLGRSCLANRAYAQPVPATGAQAVFRFEHGAAKPVVSFAGLSDELVSCLAAETRPCPPAHQGPCEVRVLVFPGDERRGPLDPTADDHWTIEARPESATPPLTLPMVHALLAVHRDGFQACLPPPAESLTSLPLAFQLAFRIRIGRDGRIAQVTQEAGVVYNPKAGAIAIKVSPKLDPRPRHPPAKIVECLTRAAYGMTVTATGLAGSQDAETVVALRFSQPRPERTSR